MEEIWKPIPGYEGYYEASNFGRIRSLDRISTCKDGRVRSLTGKVLKPKMELSKRADYRVTLWKEGVKADWLVSRLIAITFLPLPFDKLTVNHINGDFQDNRIENIEWVTKAENIRLGFETGLYHSSQKPVLLLSAKDDSSLYFESMAEASRFLKRGVQYVSKQIARSYYCYSTTGEKYFAMLTERR